MCSSVPFIHRVTHELCGIDSTVGVVREGQSLYSAMRLKKTGLRFITFNVALLKVAAVRRRGT